MKSDSRGTTKYIVYHPGTEPSVLYDRLHIRETDLSVPYMLIQGNSCMYEGSVRSSNIVVQRL